MEEKSQRPLLQDRSSSTSSIQGKRKKNYIVTGGAGFLGSHIVEHLLNLEQNVIVLDKQYPSNDILMQIEQSTNGKSKFILCDITRYNDVYRAFNFLKKQYQQQLKKQESSSSTSSLDIGAMPSMLADDKSIDSINSLNTLNSLNTSSSDITKHYKIDCVFHCAALTDPWAHPSLYENVNINGTSNVIRACQECNITKLIYTSSSNVVLDGSDCQNGDESMKYVSKKNHLNAYSYSKHKAEEKVLLANNTKCLNESYKLLTCALRPHCIFGPRDTHFISQIINKARAGKITHMIGEGHNITDFTYIDNVVHAHLLAAKALKPSNAIAAGQVYFITNGEPTLFWSFLGAILQQLGCPRPTKYISYNVAYAIALIMEFIYMIFGWIFGWKPIITRQMVVTMACHHWFSHAKATRDLGYKPIVTLDHGIKKTVQWLQWQHRGRRRSSRDSSYSSSMAGSDSTESLRSLRSDSSMHSRHSQPYHHYNQHQHHQNKLNNTHHVNHANISNRTNNSVHSQYNQHLLHNYKAMHQQQQQQQQQQQNNNNNSSNVKSNNNNHQNQNENNFKTSAKSKTKNKMSELDINNNNDEIVPLD